MPNAYLKGTIFTPSSLVITAITQTIQGVITCVVNSQTEANIYIPGMLVRLFVPSSYGMIQANNVTCRIVSVSGLNFTVNLNTSLFDAFVIPSAGIQPASMAPAGSQNLDFNNVTANVIPFQPLNNNGN